MAQLPVDLRERDSELRSLQGELVLLMAQQARRIPLQRYLTSVLMAVLLCFYVNPLLPLLWLVAVVAVVAMRTHTVLLLPEDRSRSDERKLGLAAALFWASGAVQALVVLFFPVVPVLIGAIVTIYVVGVCSATIQSTAGYRRICLPYVLVMMGPVGLVWTLTTVGDVGVVERMLFAGLILVYITTMLSHARGVFGVFMESYNIRQQREDLNRKLRSALGNAETANRAKTRFLASASHDLRQPIHALSLFSGSLLLRPMDARTSAIAEQIDKAVKSLASQLDALLDISRLDAGVIERSISSIDLSALLAQLMEEFQPQAERKGLRLTWHGPAGGQVRSDPMLLQRILRNLLSNAIKYTDSGRVELVVEPRGDKIRIGVADTGPGIPEAEQERIFEEFYQLQNPERDRSKGLGLGLAIVRRLTELLDIELLLSSAPGSGSCFSVDIPVARSEGKPVVAPEPQAGPSWRHIQVLVIDDEEAIRLGMQTLLEEMGFSVAVASSTEAAIDQARRFQPSIVLADFRLCGQDNGILAIRSLRMVWPELPALLISGDTAPDRLREARDAGVELLHKPVNATALRESILKAVNE
ncbi:ATP-binding response regulator [Solimonas sp. K1W22B-7]|uniref:ATP-binding response regulator n=1 Tax=Solimonas sp. K1W22B-7 TaxID=2303331 RepID=UPI0013C47F3D|nr:hybrid sensor histidine kinase/response regulator [Solimonas sp. K1W22B-7]